MMRHLASVAFALLALAMGARAASATGTGDLVRLNPVEVSGMPRTYLTITVPVPEPLRGADRVTFDVRLSGLTDVVGRTEGVITRSDARRVMLTLRVPAEALVGILDVADIHFRNEAGDEYVVPILLRIPAVRGFIAHGAREFRGLRTGDRVDLLYTVSNTGNAPDTLTYRLAVPHGWIARPAGTRTVVVPARGQIELPAAVTVPAAANVGDHNVELDVVAAHDSVRAQHITTTLGVTGALGQNRNGLTLRPVVAAATSRSGSATFYGASLDGEIAQDITLNARFAPPPRQTGTVSQGLSSVGASGLPFSASLTSKDWNVSVGNVGTAGHRLTGANLVGQGVSGEWESETAAARVLAARPAAGTNATGGFVGLGYSQLTSRGRFGGTVSHLEERGVFSSGRELTAVGADYTSLRVGTLVAGGSLAYRRSERGNGIGIGLSLDHERDGERASLRVLHAPGGTAGFASAENELQLTASRRMTDRWTMDAQILQTTDVGAVFRRMESRNLSLGQRYQVNRNGAVFARAQSSHFDASTSASVVGGFGSDEHTLAGGADWQFGELTLNAELSTGVVVRRSDLLNGSSSEAASGQTGVRVDATRDFERFGSVAMGGGIQFTQAGVGVPPQVWQANARWTGAPMLLLGRPFRLTSTASLQQYGELRPALTAGAGVRVALPSGLDLAMSLERNPFFRDAQGRAGMIAAVSLTASTRVFSPVVLGPEGVIFEDLNQNGRQDASEPGVANVAVRRGSSRAVSDRHGRYRLPAAARGRTTVEMATVPAGLVAHPKLGADAAEIRDVPLLATGSVSVELTLVADAEGRVPSVDLTNAVVMLRDATGFEWVGRRGAGNTAEFSGIPTGDYTVRLELSRLREPLRVDGEIKLTVAPHQRAKLIVPLHGRTVRYTVPPSRASGGRGGAK